MNETKKFANEIRINTLKMLNNLGFGHYGGSMSIIETLAVLYNDIMKYDSKNPQFEDRDYFVLSKGHAGPALYATLALKGFFPLKDLYTLNMNKTNLPSHPDRLKTKGIDVTTGSLGQGISIATGIALGLKIAKKENKVFCIIGDGEAQEGQVWEAFQFIAHNNLTNMITFIDYNKKQLDDDLEKICKPFNYEEKIKAFGLEAITVKGNDIEDIRNACMKKINKPLVIILDSIKGQGVKFIEELSSNHHIRPNEEVLEKLNEELFKLESQVF